MKRDFALVKHGHTLDDLDGVVLTTPVDHDLIEFDGTNWVNIPVSDLNARLDHGALLGLADNDHPQYELVSALTEDVQDIVGALLVDSTSIDYTYSDAGNSLTTTVITANPTALVGLSAVNGSAPTPMRSDGAPALNQGIAPTWTGIHAFTLNAKNAFTYAGTTAVTSLSFGNATDNPTFQFLGTGEVTINSHLTITSATNPGIDYIRTGSGTDLKVWRLDGFGTSLRGMTRADDLSAGNNWLLVTRGATTAIADIALGNATNNPTFSFLGTGIITSGGVHQGPAGSAATPTWSFSGDPDTGVFNVSANSLGFAVNGSRIGNFDTTGLTVGDGTGTTTTGIQINRAAGALRDFRFLTGGVNRFLFRVNATAESGSNAGSDFQLLARDDAGNAIATVWTITRSTGISTWGTVHLGPIGSASAPTWSFSSGTGDGMFRAGASNIAFATNGTQRFDISQTAITSTIPHLNAAGAATAGNVSFSFSGDTNTGMYNVGADDLGFATNGTLRFDISTTAVTSTLPYVGPAGSVTAPSFAFVGDLDNGAYYIGTNNWGQVAGGSKVVDWLKTAIAFGNATDNPTYNFLGTGIITAGGGYQGPAGAATAGNLTYGFSGDTNTGMYNVGADDLGFATNGTLRFDISTTAITSTVPHLNAAGSVSAPAYSFSADSNTGFYRTSASKTTWTGGGTAGGNLSAQGIEPISGTAGAPSHTFSSDLTTGMYRVGASDIGFSTGGTLRFDISTTAITSTLPLRAADGTNSAPSHSFTNQTDCGMFSTTGILSLAAAGVKQIEMGATYATIGNQLRLSGLISPTALAAATDNWNPSGLANASIIRMSATTSSRDLTGIVAQPGGTILILCNVGTIDIVLKNDATSTAANRFLFGGDRTVSANETVTVWYDSTTQRWRAVGVNLTATT